MMEGKAKGVISIQDLDRENAFDALAVRLLKTLANFDGGRNRKCAPDGSHSGIPTPHGRHYRISSDAALVIDHEGKVMAWNRAMEEMSGVMAADILGKGDHEYSLPFYGNGGW